MVGKLCFSGSFVHFWSHFLPFVDGKYLWTAAHLVDIAIAGHSAK